MSTGSDDHAARIAELIREPIDIVPYDPEWPLRYAEEEARLARALPVDLVLRIAHIGSTAVPGLSAKPIIDIQVEVTSLDRVRREVVRIMQDLAYEFIWRPSMGEKAPFYAWFIKRDASGRRTHHVHMVEPDKASEDRVLFRDRLRRLPEERERYGSLKMRLAAHFANDRARYTLGKSAFVDEMVRLERFNAG